MALEAPDRERVRCSLDNVNDAGIIPTNLQLLELPRGGPSGHHGSKACALDEKQNFTARHSMC